MNFGYIIEYEQLFFRFEKIRLKTNNKKVTRCGTLGRCETTKFDFMKNMQKKKMVFEGNHNKDKQMFRFL